MISKLQALEVKNNVQRFFFEKMIFLGTFLGSDFLLESDILAMFGNVLEFE